jgi:hypothetical protein
MIRYIDRILSVHRVIRSFHLRCEEGAGTAAAVSRAMAARGQGAKNAHEPSVSAKR